MYLDRVEAIEQILPEFAIRDAFGNGGAGLWSSWSPRISLSPTEAQQIIAAGAPADQREGVWFLLVVMSADEAGNLELAVKVLDATAVNGRVWVFYGALSDVGYRLHVLDTATGTERTYRNDPGTLCGAADVEAFEP